VLRARPEPPSAHAPGLPPALDAAVMKALARKPEARFETAAAFADALEGSGVTVATSRAVAVYVNAALAGALARRHELIESLGRGDAGAGVAADWPRTASSVDAAAAATGDTDLGSRRSPARETASRSRFAVRRTTVVFAAAAVLACTLGAFALGAAFRTATATKAPPSPPPPPGASAPGPSALQPRAVATPAPAPAPTEPGAPTAGQTAPGALTARGAPEPSTPSAADASPPEETSAGTPAPGALPRAARSRPARARRSQRARENDAPAAPTRSAPRQQRRHDVFQDPV
jgi:serine/threonine-protein kinase